MLSHQWVATRREGARRTSPKDSVGRGSRSRCTGDGDFDTIGGSARANREPPRLWSTGFVTAGSSRPAQGRSPSPGRPGLWSLGCHAGDAVQGERGDGVVGIAVVRPVNCPPGREVADSRRKGADANKIRCLPDQIAGAPGLRRARGCDGERCCVRLPDCCAVRFRAQFI
jgi:hypothetical protein